MQAHFGVQAQLHPKPRQQLQRHLWQGEFLYLQPGMGVQGRATHFQTPPSFIPLVPGPPQTRQGLEPLLGVSPILLLTIRSTVGQFLPFSEPQFLHL